MFARFASRIKKTVQIQFYVLLLLISSQVAKARWLMIVEYPRAAYVINSNRWLEYPGVSLPLRPLSKPECIIGPDSASDLCGVSSGRFLACSKNVFTESAAVGGFDALASLRCCEHLPSEVFFALLVFILLGVVDLSVLVLFFCSKSLSRSLVFLG